MRIGMGYDVHKLAEGRKLILGGVEIPWDMGLSGPFRRRCSCTRCDGCASGSSRAG